MHASVAGNVKEGLQLRLWGAKLVKNPHSHPSYVGAITRMAKVHKDWQCIETLDARPGFIETTYTEVGPDAVLQ